MADIAEPISLRRQKRQFALAYSKWDTVRLHQAVGADQHLYDPVAVEIMKQELEQRECPSCSTPRPAAAAACDCGHEFPPTPFLDDPEATVDPHAESMARLTAGCDGAHFQAARTIEYSTMVSLVTGIIGMLIVFVNPSSAVLFPSALAIGFSWRVRLLLPHHPDYMGASSAGRRVFIGQVLGWTAIGLYLLNLTGIFIFLFS